MKIVRMHSYGGPEVLQLEEAANPILRSGQVLVKVEASGVNFADVMRRYDSYLEPTPLPFVPGMEAAGTVVQVGEGANKVKVGARVVGLTVSGAYAEYVALPEALLSILPDEISLEQAVALPVQGLTAYHLIKTFGRLQPGESILVHAAAGGVGTLAVQLARLLGAGKIIATASSPQKLAMAEALGADVLINYTEPGWTQQVRMATGGKGVDVILEMAGGEIFNDNFKCLAAFGRIVAYGSSSSSPGQFPNLRLEVPALQLMKRGQSLSGFYLSSITNKAELILPIMQELFQYVLSGKLKLNVKHIYSLSEVVKAHQLLESRQTVGKVVLHP